MSSSVLVADISGGKLWAFRINVTDYFVDPAMNPCSVTDHYLNVKALFFFFFPLYIYS